MSSQPENIIAKSGVQFVQDERPDLQALVPADARTVLDVGCGAGRLGGALKRRGAERVVGLELNPAAARAAEEQLDEVLVCDVGSGDLPFPDGAFDCIVYGDILEHLVDPWATLRAHRRLVAPGGRIVVSIPNIAFWRVSVGLLRGRFEYQPSGTLDGTHLRFFTLRSLERLCEQGGFRVVAVHTSLGRGKSAWLNRLTRRKLEHLLVWRYVVEAVPA